MEARKKQFCFVLIVIIFASGTLSSVYAQTDVSKVTQKRCENLYLKYKELGIDEFKKRYSNHSLLKVCLKLFDDPNWDFKGKSKIDKYFEQLKRNTTKPSNEKFDVSVKIEKKLSIGQERFLIKFVSCSNVHVTKPSFLISSDSEKFLGISSKHLPKGVCQSSWTQIFAKNPDAVLVQFIEDTSTYPTLKIKQI